MVFYSIGRELIFFGIRFMSTMNSKNKYEFRRHGLKYFFIIISNLLAVIWILPQCLFWTFWLGCSTTQSNFTEAWRKEHPFKIPPKEEYVCTLLSIDHL